MEEELAASKYEWWWIEDSQVAPQYSAAARLTLSALSFTLLLFEAAQHAGLHGLRGCHWPLLSILSKNHFCPNFHSSSLQNTLKIIHILSHFWGVGRYLRLGTLPRPKPFLVKRPCAQRKLWRDKQACWLFAEEKMGMAFARHQVDQALL